MLDEHLQVVDVARLALPTELGGPECMIGPWVWMRRRIRRLAPWLVPGQRPRGCCWHHQVDWGQAAGIAIRLVGQAQAAGIQQIELDDYFIDATHDENLDEQTQTAALLLVTTGTGIQPNNDPDDPTRYYDGQHRVAAHVDQGVRQTIVQLEVPDY